MPSSTIPLSRTIGLASQFVRNAPLTFTSPSTNDPAFSNADWVRQFILSPPFAWRWNRAVVEFTCTIGTADYTESVPTFGWIEKAVILDPDNGNQSTELEVDLNLAEETVPNLPTKISAQSDDGEGNITFRLFPAPDKAYVVRVTYQKAASIFTAASDTWSPIPDYLSYLYNQGFLAKTLDYINDPRFPNAMQLFLSQVVAANQGLSETERNIFLGDRLNTQRESQAVASGRR